MQKKELIIVSVVLILAAAIAGWYVWSVYQSPTPVVPSAPVAAPAVAPQAPAAAVTTSSLGASLLEKAQNPIQDKVPEIAPTANPIKNVYNNPFE